MSDADNLASALESLAAAAKFLRAAAKEQTDAPTVECAQSLLSFTRDIDEKIQQVKGVQKRISEKKP